jgi:alpha-L-fucosidase 2
LPRLVPLAAFRAPQAPAIEGSTLAPDQPLSLWYGRPAADHPLAAPAAAARQGANAEWVQALPIGNGRLGAMVFGGVVYERLHLNEDTIWAGGPYDPVNPEARAALPDVRALIAEGRFKEPPI